MKKILGLIAVLSMAVISCKKDSKEPNDTHTGAVISVVGMSQVTALQILPYTDERVLEIKIQSNVIASKNISVSLREDAATFDRLNDQRIADGLEPYERLPYNGYEFDFNGLVIAAGTQESEAIKLKYFPHTFSTDKDYLLALKVVESSDYDVDKTHGVILISNSERINSRVSFNTSDPDDLVAPIMIFPFADERTLSFDVKLEITTLPQEDIQVSIAPDAEALAAINAQRASDGLSLYEAFPDDGFSIDKTELTITSGENISDQGILTYYPEKFDPSKEYLLPITIVSARGYTIDPERNTLLITVPKYTGTSNQITAAEMANEQWAVTASTWHDQPTAMRPPSAVIDGNYTTWWASRYGNVPTSQFQPNPFNAPFPHWLRIDMKEAKYIHKIRMHRRYQTADTQVTFTTFNLKGSVDGIKWFDLKSNLSFPFHNVVQGNPAQPVPDQWPEYEVNGYFRYLQVDLPTKNPLYTGTEAHIGSIWFYAY